MKEPTLIELQEDTVASLFSDLYACQERYDRIRFSKASHKEKRQALNCLNSALKRYITSMLELERLKEILL